MIDTQKLSAWIAEVQGQYINVDGAAGAQCWDLAAHWSQALGLPRISTWGNGRWPGWAGNMVDAFPQSPAIAAAYELHGPDEPAQPGDIAVWGDSYWYYPKTHVAVVIRDGGLLTCMSQNSTPSRAGNPYPEWTTGPTTLQALPKQGLIGYIRPRGGLAAQGSITEGDIFMALTDAEQKRLLAAADRINGRVKDQDVLNAADGAYMNNTRDAQFAAVMEALGKTLNKDDGGYIVKLVQAIKPGTTDVKAVADALAGIIPASIAKEVADELSNRLKG